MQGGWRPDAECRAVRVFVPYQALLEVFVVHPDQEDGWGRAFGPYNPHAV